MADCKTLGSVIDAMSNQTSWPNRKPIVVIDAGIATDGNIAMLKNKGYDYMCANLINFGFVSPYADHFISSY